jgi:Methyltransferase domain
MQLQESLKHLISMSIPSLVGWCTPEKALVLAGLVSDHKPTLAVEIGVFGGRSLIPMALALRAVGCGVAYGIDPWTIEAAIEGNNGPANDGWWINNSNLENVYISFVHSVIDHGLTRECRWMRLKSDVAVRLFDDASIGLFHLDGNHSELTSCRDVEQWHKKIAPGGVWVLDDADWESQKKAIQMIHDFGFSVVKEYGTFTVFKRA